MIWTRTGAASGFNPAAVPNPGTGFAYATIGNKLYLIGGESSGSPMLKVQEYDLDTNAWTVLTDAPRSTSGLHAAAVIDGLIHYFDASGGFTSYDPSDGTAVALAAPPAGGDAQKTDLHVIGRDIYANVMAGSPWRYNVDDDAWYQDVAAHPAAAGGDVYEVLSGVHDGLLYTHSKATEEQHYYDPNTDSWTEFYSAFIRSHRYGGNAVWTPDGYWYAINGSSGTTNSPTTLAEFYNPLDDDQVYTLDVPPDARIDFAIATLGDYIIVVGGTVGGVEEGDTYAGLRYARRDATVWTEGLADMPTPQRGTAYAPHNGELWILGGLGTATLAQSYDPETETWTSRPALSTGIDDDGARGAVHGGLIYFSSFTAGWASYDPSDGTVTSLPAEPTYGSVGGHDASIVGDKLYALMGVDPNAVYDFNAGTWGTVTACPTYLGAANQTVLDGKIYVLSQGDPEIYFYAYDPDTDGWTALTPLPIYAPNTQIEATSAGTIIATGTGDGPFAWEYDPDTDSWASMAAPPVTRENPAMAEANGYLAFAGGEERVWTSGGVTTGPADEAFAYQVPVSEVQATLQADLSTEWPVDATATLNVEFDSHPTLHVTLSVGWPAEALLPVHISTARDGAAAAGATLAVHFTTIDTAGATLSVIMHVATPDGTPLSATPYDVVEGQPLAISGMDTIASIEERVGAGRIATLTRQGDTPPDASSPVQLAQVAVRSDGTSVRYDLARSVLAPTVGPAWSLQNGVPTWEVATRNPGDLLDETTLPELTRTATLTGGGMTTATPSGPGPLHSLDAPLGTDLPTSEDCSERETVAPLLGTRLDLATAAAAEAGMILTILGTVPYMDAAPPSDYRTEGQTAAQVISDMLLASNPRVWYAPGEVVIDGRILPTVATTSDPDDLLPAEDRAHDGVAYTELAAESEAEPLLADYLERCERRDESNPSSGGTFETFDTGVYEWVTRGGTGGDYQETTHELEKESGRLTREAEETEGYFEPFDGATYWGTVSRSEITNEYHAICPEALVARSEFTMQRKRRSDLSRFSGVDEADGGAPWSRSTEDLLYDAIPTWYRQKTVDVEQAWHAEGWLRMRISTARELEGMVAAPVRDVAGDITGYNVTLLYRRETREETYTPIGDGLWHIATTIRTTEQQPVYEPVNPDAVDGDPDYGLVELVGVQPVPVSNAYTVTTDQAPPSISCGDPCNEGGYDGCVAEQTARWEEDHANWEARQARNAARRVWTVTAIHLLPAIHLGQLVAGGVVTSVSHERDFTAGGSTFEVTQWIA